MKTDPIAVSGDGFAGGPGAGGIRFGQRQHDAVRRVKNQHGYAGYARPVFIKDPAGQDGIGNVQRRSVRRRADGQRRSLGSFGLRGFVCAEDAVLRLLIRIQGQSEGPGSDRAFLRRLLPFPGCESLTGQRRKEHRKRQYQTKGFLQTVLHSRRPPSIREFPIIIAETAKQGKGRRQIAAKFFLYMPYIRMNISHFP